MYALQTAERIRVSVRCAIVSCAVTHANALTIAALRKQPTVIASEPMSASFLKHSEEQTVVAIETVRAAIGQFTEPQPEFRDWGVVAAANFFGRIQIARSITAYPTDGAWGVSPHLIPHQSLHAISGTLSQSLKAYGPNFGVGGGPNSVREALLLAASLLADSSLPGLWLILTGYESERIPSADANVTPTPNCCGIAMALRPTIDATYGPELRLGEAANDDAIRWLAEPQLDAIAEAVAQRQSTRWRVGGRIVAELDFAGDLEAR